MQRQPRNSTLRQRIDRARGRPAGPPAPPVRKRRVSRREREARQRRLLYWGMGIAGALVVLVLAGSAINQYVIKPRTVLATVGDTDIRRRDYWKVRSMNLIEQASQYQQYAQLVGPDQADQYRQAAAQAQQELKGVWGSTQVDDQTLEHMIDDQVYLQHLDNLGLQLTDKDVETSVLQQFSPPDAPLLTPAPSPTLIPARAAWATQTAIANQPPSPVPTGASLPPPPGLPPLPGTPSAIGAGHAIAASPVASPVASPILGTPVGTPAVSPTPNAEQARSTAVAGYDQFQKSVFAIAHLSRADYERLIARPTLARQKVTEALSAKVGQTAEQVHAAHILVATHDLAQQISQQASQPGADFAQLARQQSTDKATAVNGGDLGWFAREEMVAPFADVAFKLQPGQVSQPFQTQFGWHVVKVFEHAQDRPLTDTQIEKIKQARVDGWLKEQKAATHISSDIKPTPTPEAEQFAPPAGAPTPPPTPVATPAASPVASPPPPPLAAPPVATP